MVRCEDPLYYSVLQDYYSAQYVEMLYMFLLILQSIQMSRGCIYVSFQQM